MRGPPYPLSPHTLKYLNSSLLTPFPPENTPNDPIHRPHVMRVPTPLLH